jgi:hypothetical protein
MLPPSSGIYRVDVNDVTKVSVMRAAAEDEGKMLT